MIEDRPARRGDAEHADERRRGCSLGPDGADRKQGLVLARGFIARRRLRACALDG